MVRPLTEMQNLMKLIRKTITKRDHKLVDYDRFRISLKKLQDKKERSLSDEKSIYKVRIASLRLVWIGRRLNGSAAW